MFHFENQCIFQVIENILRGIDNGHLNGQPFGGRFSLYFDDRDSVPGKIEWLMINSIFNRISIISRRPVHQPLFPDFHTHRSFYASGSIPIGWWQRKVADSIPGRVNLDFKSFSMTFYSIALSIASRPNRCCRNYWPVLLITNPGITVIQLNKYRKRSETPFKKSGKYIQSYE